MMQAAVRRRSLFLLCAGIAILLATAVCGYGSAAPPATVDLGAPSGGGAPEPTSAAAAGETSEPVTILPSPTAEQPGAPEQVAPPPAIPESRRVTLEYPPSIRVGDSDIVRLTLEVDNLGNVTPTAETQGNVVKGQTVEIPNLYDTHTVIAEARLDLAGVDLRPESGDIREPLLPGQSATFYWSVHLSDQGTYRGTVWLILHYVNKVTKEESTAPISAQTIEISTSSLFGMGGSLARIVGGLGSILGAVLGLPFADDVLKWIWRRIRGGA